MWERRYGFPEPARTPGGARRYSEDDINTLKLVAQALETGYRAGDVVGRPAASLRALIAEQLAVPPSTRAPSGAPPDVETVVKDVMKDDLPAARDGLRQAVAALGPKLFLTDFAHPLAIRIGDLWETGELAIRQEHAASELLTTQIRALLAGFEARGGDPQVLITALPGEQHALPLEMVALYLVLQGATPRSLGVSTPIREIAGAAVALDVDVVGISVSAAADPGASSERVDDLIRELPRRMELWIGGQGAEGLDLTSSEAHAVTTWKRIDEELARWRGENAG
jgi:methanogenic corrinoid protein MtbC1